MATMKACGREMCRVTAAIALALGAQLFSIDQSAARPLDGEQTADMERRLVDALNAIQGQQVENALREIEGIAREQPDFRLAQVVYGDLLLAMASPIHTIGVPSAAAAGQLGGILPEIEPSMADDLRMEAQVRWRHHASPPVSGHLPANLLQLAPHHRHAIAIDLVASRLYLFEQGKDGLQLKEHRYATQGKNGAGKHVEGDKRTPIGVYRITGYIPDEKLPDLYGSGAFPVDYPNEWDLRLGRTGYGIWLHGNPSDTFSRPPRASDGCVTLANADFESIGRWIDVGSTPVVISDRLEWVSQQELAQRRSDIVSTINQWISDWESLDQRRYLGHYSSQFNNGKHDLTSWSSYKRRVNGNKQFIEVEINDLSIFAYPGDDPMVVVDFRQNYRSSNFNGESNKRMYWGLEEDGRWRILYEG